MGGGAIASPPAIPGSSQMKMQFVPASHGQNTLGTDVPRIIRHDGAKNRVGRVPGTRTGAADLDYEGNVYTEKRVMWETLSPEVPTLTLLYLGPLIPWVKIGLQPSLPSAS